MTIPTVIPSDEYTTEDVARVLKAIIVRIKESEEELKILKHRVENMLVSINVSYSRIRAIAEVHNIDMNRKPPDREEGDD